jgi:hypothetical protein
VKLPVLAEQMIPAQPLRRNIPNPHLLFSLLTNGDGQDLAATYIDALTTNSAYSYCGWRRSTFTPCPTLPRRDAAFHQAPLAGSLHPAGCEDER